MHRKPLAVAALAVALLASACNGHASRSALQPASPSATATATPTASQPVVPATTPPATATPSPTLSPTPTPPSYDVRAVQTRLLALHYYGGTVDGQIGGALTSAVMAFQKVNGLSVDGSVGPQTLAALSHPVTPVLRDSGGGTRVEVDLTRQVLYVVEGGAIARILPVSSGNGAHYLTKSGYWATALTPVGHYVILRRIVGVHQAELGTLYDPQFFYQGWAIHGSDSVPAYPASHGCIRVTRADGTYLLRAIAVGTPVYIYGGTHVFTAGSSAPGTTDPGGDTGPSVQPTPSPSASPRPVRSPSPSPAPHPSTTPTPTASPTPAAP